MKTLEHQNSTLEVIQVPSDSSGPSHVKHVKHLTKLTGKRAKVSDSAGEITKSY